MAKLLVVDDEINICTLIKKYAAHEGHEVEIALNGRDAVRKCESQPFDVIIMDVMMPVMNGYEAVEEIRSFLETPIIMLTAKGQEYDKIKAFDLDVDDYVVKPFSVKELMMRVNAILKRVRKFQKKEDVYGELVIDYTAHKVTVHGKELDLSPKEYALLILLASNKNQVIERDRIIEEVWGFDYEGDDRTLDTHIKLLRRNLEDYKDCIVTVRGVGYRFEYREEKQ